MAYESLIYLPALQHDEPLHGFNYRAAWANGYSSSSQMFQVLSPNSNGNIDSLANLARLGFDVSSGTTSQNLAWECERDLPEPHSVDLRLNKPRFCTACLQCKRYYRALWDHAYYHACHLHETWLSTHCQQCGERYRWTNMLSWRCNCGELICSPKNGVDTSVNNDLLRSAVDLSAALVNGSLDTKEITSVVAKQIRPGAQFSSFLMPNHLPIGTLRMLALSGYLRLNGEWRQQRQDSFIPLIKVPIPIDQTAKLANLFQTKPTYFRAALRRFGSVSHVDPGMTIQLNDMIRDTVKAIHLASYLGLETSVVYELVASGLFQLMEPNIKTPEDWTFDLSKIEATVVQLSEKVSMVDDPVSLADIMQSDVPSTYNITASELIHLAVDGKEPYTTGIEGFLNLLFDRSSIEAYMKRSIRASLKPFSRLSASKLLGLTMSGLAALVNHGYLEVENCRSARGQKMSRITNESMRGFFNQYVILNSMALLLGTRPTQINSWLEKKGIFAVSKIPYGNYNQLNIYTRGTKLIRTLQAFCNEHNNPSAMSAIDIPFDEPS